MSVLINARGTSHDTFKVGNTGPVINRDGSITTAGALKINSAADVAVLTTDNTTLNLVATKVQVNGVDMSESLPTVIETASWDYAVEVTSPSIVVLTLTAPACTLDVQAPCQSFRLALVQGTGANKVTWPSNVRWPYGVPPVLSYTQGHIDLFEFLSPNADGQWFGFFLGGGF